MPDFGFWELGMIAVIALLVVGPERLPGLARDVGQWIGKARRFINSVRSDIEREIDAAELKRMLGEQQDEIQELKGMISETQAEVESELRDTDKLVKSSGGAPGSEDPPTSTPTHSQSQATSLSTPVSSNDDRQGSTGD